MTGAGQDRDDSVAPLPGEATAGFGRYQIFASLGARATSLRHGLTAKRGARPKWSGILALKEIRVNRLLLINRLVRLPAWSRRLPSGNQL